MNDTSYIKRFRATVTALCVLMMAWVTAGTAEAQGGQCLAATLGYLVDSSVAVDRSALVDRIPNDGGCVCEVQADNESLTTLQDPALS